MISQEGRRKQFLMGGRATVKEVLMRRSGHGLLSTTKMALEVVGSGDINMGKRLIPFYLLQIPL